MSDADTVRPSAPPFARAMKTLAVVFAAVWLLELLLQGTGIGGFRGPLGPFEPLALVPASVLQRGAVWQLATYALLHDPSNALGLVVTVVTLWFAGSPIERLWGVRRALALVGASVAVGAAAVLVAGLVDASVFRGATVSPAAVNTALLAAWCLAHARDRMSLFGLVTLTGRQLLTFAVGFAVLQLLWQRSGAAAASLSGFAVGWAFTRWPTRSEPRATRRPGVGSARFKVIQGGRGGDLPN